VADGVLVLRPDDSELPLGFHAEVCQRAHDLLHTDSGTPELLRHVELMQALPQLSQLCATPTVQGALASVLGQDYAQHPHRHLHHPSGHINPAANVDRECARKFRCG
jgi:hypothetical protein